MAEGESVLLSLLLLQCFTVPKFMVIGNSTQNEGAI